MILYRIIDILPHSSAVEMNHHPLGRVECERLRMLNAGNEVAIFGADEGRAGVGGVYVHPDVMFLTCDDERRCQHNVRHRSLDNIERIIIILEYNLGPRQYYVRDCTCGVLRG